MKRIIFSSNTSFSLFNFRLGLMKKLKALGYEVIAVAPRDEYSQALKKEGFPYFEIKNLDRKGKNPLKDLKLFWEYFNLYKKIKPDLVINYTIKPNIYGSSACGILRIPSISVVTGLGYVFLKGGILAFIVKNLYKFSFRASRFVVFQNPQDMEELKSVVDNEKIYLILGSGVDLDYFSPHICKEIKKREKFIFLYIGRFLKDKGIVELLKAGEQLYKERKNFEIWFLGGPDSGNPQSFTEDEMKNFEKLPFVKVLPFARDVRPFICDADCVVLPSYREGVPRSLLEGMAMERPIITTDAPGCREACKYGVNGFLVRPRDVESLHFAMQRMLQLPEEKRIEMGKEGRKLVQEKFSEEIVIEKYLKLIEKILGTS